MAKIIFTITMSVIFFNISFNYLNADENYDSDVCKQFRQTYNSLTECQNSCQRAYSGDQQSRCLRFCNKCIKIKEDEFLNNYMK